MTWYDNENYGTALQAYALQSIVSSYAECEIIPYKSRHPGYGVRDIVDPVLRKNLMWKIYERTLFKIYSDRYCHLEEDRRKKMLAFFDDKLSIANNISPNDFESYVNEHYDAIVCGSDQIWNPTRYDRHFFLDFVSNNIPKIAYAPSFGVSRISDKSIETDIRYLLGRFDYLSVREMAGQEIIRTLIKKEVPICLDPTLLLDSEFWNNLADESRLQLPEKYTYAYLLGRNQQHFIKSKRFADALDAELLLQPYYVADYFKPCKRVAPSGPADFLNAIRNSEFVCTDSFHGLIFAIIFERPFIVFKRFRNGNVSSQNSRIETLLKYIDMEDRLVVDTNSSMDNLLTISFDECREKLNAKRNDSIDYLRTALNVSLCQKE